MEQSGNDPEGKRFANYYQGQPVFAQVEMLGDDGEWQPVAGAGFPGVVTHEGVDDSGNPVVLVLPNYKLPRGDAYATGAPWAITGTPFCADRDGKGHLFRFVVNSVDE